MAAAPGPAPAGVVLAAVALGGALGACARVAVGQTWPASGLGFPWTTFAVNVTGCALLALLPALAVVRRIRLLPPLLGTGALGGFTTLSAWSAETHALVAGDRSVLAAVYVLGTVVACFTVVAVIDRLSSPAARAAFEVEEGDL